MQLELWQVLVLAVVQGVTEFLPISSDGHLVVITPWLTGGETPSDMNAIVVMLHMGTLASILVFYHRALFALLTRDLNTIPLLILGTIPAVLVGLPLEKWGDAILNSPLLAALFLPVTGLIVLYAARGDSAGKQYQQLRWWDALLIGLGQAVAILPGISRSGCTIAAGVKVGLARPSAATFSFLLGAPVIAGAGLLKAVKMVTEKPPETSIVLLGIGALVSFLVGLAALSWLVRWLERGKLHYFGWYCIVLGGALSAWQLYRLAVGPA
jgi:undecaprenyl-diphosphatase